MKVNRDASLEQIIDTLQAIEHTCAGRYGVIIYLSRLKPYNRADHQVNAAFLNFKNSIDRFGQPCYLLPNSDIIYISQDMRPLELETVVAKYKKQFSNDPLTQNSYEGEKFYRIFDLGLEYKNFWSIIIEMKRELDSASRFNLNVPTSNLDLIFRSKSNSLPVTGLLELQNILRQADVSNFIRCQSICWVERDLSPHPMRMEFYLSIKSLEQALMPDTDLTANIWLFKHLTMSIDRRMLLKIADLILQGRLQSCNVNLNSRSIISKNFRDFQERIKHVCDDVVIEIDKIDIMSDPQSFFYVRDFCIERGYKVCVDGLDYYSLKYFSHPAFHNLIFKIFWSQELLASLENNPQNPLKEMMMEVPEDNVILARCENPDALDFGSGIGIKIYQGYFIDDLLKKRIPS